LGNRSGGVDVAWAQNEDSDGSRKIQDNWALLLRILEYENRELKNMAQFGRQGFQYIKMRGEEREVQSPLNSNILRGTGTKMSERSMGGVRVFQGRRGETAVEESADELAKVDQKRSLKSRRRTGPEERVFGR